MNDRIGKQEQPAVTPQIRAMVVEDSPVAMRALANLLEMHSLIKCVGTASDGQEGLKLIEEYEPDLVLVDMEMPGLGGLGLVERLRKQFPAMRLVIVSTHEGHVWQQLSQRHGADAFMAKQRLHDNFAELLRRLFPGAGAPGTAMAHKELTK